MNLDIINRTIGAMCSEVKSHSFTQQDWRLLTEDELFYEAAVCIIGSQMVFEMAVATADHLHDVGLIQPQNQPDLGKYESRIVTALSEPIALKDRDGLTRWVRPRFKNRLASLLATTVSNIYGNGRSIRDLLLSAKCAKDARKALVKYIWGFGPKQASLFLRRVGLCSDLAVLDVHVLEYLQLARGLTLTPNRLARLSSYEEIEDTFRGVAKEFGHSVGCVDLAMWLTMRVAKREAFL